MKTCKTCNSCKMLYDRGWYRYFRRGRYYCTEHERIVALCDVCDKHSAKEHIFDLSSERFGDAEKDIKIISELLGMGEI